ncbi:MAG: chloride channel protein [Kiritimatiellae bacterium]|nr:chloride channel protein [Kiritimatiellia bacterium]
MLSGLSRSSFRLFLSGNGMSFRTGRYFLEAAFLGGLTGLVTAGFEWMIEAMGRVAAKAVSLGGAWAQAILPAVGAVAGALVISRFAHVKHARGTDSAVRAFHQDEDIPRTVIPVKSVASVLTVGCGGSAGYEGPVTLLGAACARVVTRLLRLDRRAARILLAAGVGAGIAALFRAPLAGAIFGAEIFYSSSDLEYEALLPSFIASTTSYTVFACFWGWDALFSMPATPFEKGLHLLPYFVLAFVVTFGARLYIMLFRTVEHSFGKAKGPIWLKVATGGLVVGALAWAVPGWANGLRGAGYEVVERCFAFSAGRDIAWSVPLGFLGFFALKMVATSFTVGSGGSGGVFAPALVCGGALGMATGLFFLKVLPMWVGIVPAEFALVGMAGFLASAIRVPIAAVVMVAEISGNHELLMPAMWVCGISFWLNNGWSLYRSQVHSRESSPLH